MAADDIEIIQNLRIFTVEREGVEVRVDIYGGDESVCGSLLYTFSSVTEARDRARLLSRWGTRGTAVTYVSRDGAASLMDEAALLDAALDS